MTLTATINGQPVTIEIPDAAQVPRLALTKAETAKALGVGLHQVWKLQASGQICKTAYGTYPVASLQAHLAAEMKREAK